jgi:hypothetical protein
LSNPVEIQNASPATDDQQLKTHNSELETETEVPYVQTFQPQQVEVQTSKGVMKLARCKHIKFDGVQCGSPALRGREHCFYHHRCRRNRKIGVVLPLLENAKAINFAAMQTAEALLCNNLDRRVASQVLFALKIASINLRHMQPEPAPHELALDDPSEFTYMHRLDEVIKEMDRTGKDLSPKITEIIDDRTRGLDP